jgi:hypothetical protein
MTSKKVNNRRELRASNRRARRWSRCSSLDRAISIQPSDLWLSMRLPQAAKHPRVSDHAKPCFGCLGLWGT